LHQVDTYDENSETKYFGFDLNMTFNQKSTWTGRRVKASNPQSRVFMKAISPANEMHETLLVAKLVASIVARLCEKEREVFAEPGMGERNYGCGIVASPREKRRSSAYWLSANTSISWFRMRLMRGLPACLFRAGLVAVCMPRLGPRMVS
jgi:hypothetical protein